MNGQGNRSLQPEQIWRTEPEIDEKRQRYLAECLANPPRHSAGIFPFKNIKLTRADIEWLLAEYENGLGPVNWKDEREQRRRGLDLRGADLRGVNLDRLPLTRVSLGLAWNEWLGGNLNELKSAAAHLEGASLIRAHLEGASLIGVHLEGASLDESHLEQADLIEIHLEKAFLDEAHLERANLTSAHLEGASLSKAHLERANLAKAHLEGANLNGAHLADADLRETHLEGSNLNEAHLERADLYIAHLEKINLRNASLERANLSKAYLEGANLREAHLEGSNLAGTHLEGKEMSADNLKHIRQWEKNFPEILLPADLRLAFFDNATRLEGIILGDGKYGYVPLADVSWGGTNLTVVDWASLKLLGDEQLAIEKKTREGIIKNKSDSLREFRAAVRANRQLATTLRTQGMSEEADRFAYRAQVLQRRVILQQIGLPKVGLWERIRRCGSYIFSMFLDVLAGYGYKPAQTLLWYLAVIFGFAVAYYFFGHLPFKEAFVLSLTSFHGRGFFSSNNISLSNPIVMVAAGEAVVGLLIEISFIATFTQRFFGR